MNKNKLTVLSIAASLIMAACNPENDAPVLIPGKGSFIDHGFIPAEVTVVGNTAIFQTAIFNNNHVIVITNDGLWKNNLSTKEWSRAGLTGKTISVIYKHPTIANKLYAGTVSDGTPGDKTFFISTNGGDSWEPATTMIFDDFNNHYETYVCLAVRPGNPDHIYANVNGGAMIAVSADGGLNWKRMNNEPESYFGYGCNIIFKPENATQIFQGSENPLDDAWLGKYDINNADPVLLTNFEKVVDMTTWGNRRPNELQTYPSDPNTIYVGQEGALSKVTGTAVKYIFKAENNNFPYSYISAIWIDANNPDHLLFGGFLNNLEQPMSLYETYNEGERIARIENKLGLENPLVFEIIATNTFPAILVEDQDTKKVKLVLYHY